MKLKENFIGKINGLEEAIILIGLLGLKKIW